MDRNNHLGVLRNSQSGSSSPLGNPGRVFRNPKTRVVLERRQSPTRMTLTSHGSSTALDDHPYTLTTLPRSSPPAPPPSPSENFPARTARAKEDGWWWTRLRERIIHYSKFGPLLAAVAAPFSTLLDIPALCVNPKAPELRARHPGRTDGLRGWM